MKMPYECHGLEQAFHLGLLHNGLKTHSRDMQFRPTLQCNEGVLHDQIIHRWLDILILCYLEKDRKVAIININLWNFFFHWHLWDLEFYLIMGFPNLEHRILFHIKDLEVLSTVLILICDWLIFLKCEVIWLKRLILRSFNEVIVLNMLLLEQVPEAAHLRPMQQLIFLSWELSYVSLEISTLNIFKVYFHCLLRKT